MFCVHVHMCVCVCVCVCVPVSFGTLLWSEVFLGGFDSFSVLPFEGPVRVIFTDMQFYIIHVHSLYLSPCACKSFFLSSLCVQDTTDLLSGSLYLMCFCNPSCSWSLSPYTSLLETLN